MLPCLNPLLSGHGGALVSNLLGNRASADDMQVDSVLDKDRIGFIKYDHIIVLKQG